MKNKDDYLIVSTREVKLKDDPPERRSFMLILENTFGQVPEAIVVEKVKGKNNMVLVRGFIKKQGITN